MQHVRAPGSSLIIGNLDCEADYAGESRTRAAAGAPTSRDPLAREVLLKISHLATLLRVFALDQPTALWTPLPVDPGCVPELPGLVTPRWESGALAGAPPAAAGVLPWGETANKQRLPCDCASTVRSVIGSAPLDATSRAIPDWIPRLWMLPPAAVGSAARVNHRGFAFDLARDLDCALPGAFRARELRELKSGIRERACPASPEGRWVAKAPWSAAGRARVHGKGDELRGDEERRLEKLFAEQGELMVEPWMPRTADFGVSAIVTPARVELLGIHAQHSTAKGQFAAISLRLESPPASLREDERKLLIETARAAGAHLRNHGYLGPFGIDAWRYVAQDGVEHLNPLGEINARMTFGMVARAFAGRLRGVLKIDENSVLSLALGQAPPDVAGSERSALPLLYDAVSRPIAFLMVA